MAAELEPLLDVAEAAEVLELALGFAEGLCPLDWLLLLREARALPAAGGVGGAEADGAVTVPAADPPTLEVAVAARLWLPLRVSCP